MKAPHSGAVDRPPQRPIPISHGGTRNPWSLQVEGSLSLFGSQKMVYRGAAARSEIRKLQPFM